MSVYADLILDHYQFPRCHGTIESPDHTTHVSNPLCGDELDFTIKMKGETIDDIAFQGKGCAISLASASMMCESVKGKKKSFVLSLTSQSVLDLLGIALTPNRLKCALLSLEGIQSLFLEKSHV